MTREELWERARNNANRYYEICESEDSVSFVEVKELIERLFEDVDSQCNILCEKERDERYYSGERNAFLMCINLLEKVEE